jgi:uncharacterized protein (TIGR02598 family)
MQPSVRSYHCNLAFSLVEVVMALGILSFAVIPLCGLLPVCLSTAKDAAEYSRRSQIVQETINSLQQSPFSKLIASNSITLRYSYEGGPVSADSPEYFVVQGTVSPSTSLPGIPPTVGMATVKLEVSTPSHQTNHYATIIADSGN